MSQLQHAQTLPTLDDLEAFFVNNSDLHRIKAHLGRFNPIKVMGMQRMEIRHSAILRWLMDPQESHGLGDAFLKAFLSEAMRGHDGSLNPSALKVSQSDMTDAEVRCEWRSIDLLVLSPANRWVFVIENKYHSAQHTEQLRRYMEVAETTFIKAGAFEHLRGVFLTLWGEEPEDKRYAPIRYDVICQLIDQVRENLSHPLAPQVAAFIHHYVEIIREVVRMDDGRSELEKVARELYRDHKKVLDFIVENGKSTDFVLAVEAIFGENRECLDEKLVDDQVIVFDQVESSVVSFLPKSWFVALGGDDLWWDGCQSWWTTLPLITRIQLTTDADGSKGQIRLFAEVGPLKDHGFRTNLIEAIQHCASKSEGLRINFQRGATDEGKKYSRFFKSITFPIDDVHDYEKIAIAIRFALKSFQPEFDAVAKVLPQFIGHGTREEPK